MLPVLLSLLIMSNSACISGDVTLYEDMSYTISESTDTVSCVESSEDQITFTEVTMIGNGLHSAVSYNYTRGNPFPESIMETDTNLYISKGF